MSLETVKAAAEARDEAEKVLRGEARSTLNELVTDLLNQDGIQNVSWAQKSGEYNDEGMYPGVHGPFINLVDDPENYGEIRDNNRELMGYNYPATPVDARAKDLESALDFLGEEIVADIFGEESAVVAYLVDGKVEYTVEELGW